MFEIEELSFERLIFYYQRKERQDTFMSIINMQSGVVNSMNASNKRTRKVRMRGVSMMRAVGRKVLGRRREINPPKCNAYKRLGHVAANFYVSRPCYKCGRYGHSLVNCWGKNPPLRGNCRGEYVHEVASHS